MGQFMVRMAPLTGNQTIGQNSLEPPRMVVGSPKGRNGLPRSFPARHQPRRFFFWWPSAAMAAKNNGPESGSCHGKTDLPSPGSASSELSARYRYSQGVHGETSALMNRIAASCVAWGRFGNSRSRAGQKGRGNLVLITLGESMERAASEKETSDRITARFRNKRKSKKMGGRERI